MGQTILQIRDGEVALPTSLRNRYKLKEGDSLTLIDLGGVFVLAPQIARVPELAAELERQRKAAKLSLANLQEGLDEQRRIYAAKKYGRSTARPKTSYRRRRSGRRRVLQDGS